MRQEFKTKITFLLVENRALSDFLVFLFLFLSFFVYVLVSNKKKKKS